MLRLQIRKLQIDDGDAVELSNAWDLMVSLTDLSTVIPSLECITAVFSTPKSKIKKLTLEIKNGKAKEIEEICRIGTQDVDVR